MQVIFCIGPVQDMIDVNEKALWPPARPAMQRCIKTRTVNVFKDPSTLHYLINVGVRLLIFEQNSTQHVLIPYHTFITALFF